MEIKTTRFGLITIAPSDVVVFNEGILGFVDSRSFVFLDDPHDEIFAWLQSCDKPGVAFPILEPELFMGNYSVSLTRHEMAALKLEPNSKKGLFTIVTIPEDATQMTANLKAPIVINIKERLGRQVIAQENDYPIKFPIFSELQKRWVQNPSANFKFHSQDWEAMAVRLPGQQSPGSEINV